MQCIYRAKHSARSFLPDPLAVAHVRRQMFGTKIWSVLNHKLMIFRIKCNHYKQNFSSLTKHLTISVVCLWINGTSWEFTKAIRLQDTQIAVETFPLLFLLLFLLLSHLPRLFHLFPSFCYFIRPQINTMPKKTFTFFLLKEKHTPLSIFYELLSDGHVVAIHRDQFPRFCNVSESQLILSIHCVAFKYELQSTTALYKAFTSQSLICVKVVHLSSDRWIVIHSSVHEYWLLLHKAA